MARKKRGSRVLDAAKKRAAGISSVVPALDLGDGVTLATYKIKIKEVGDKLDAYNELLSNIDGALNEVVAGEKVLRDLSERMLGGVGSKFGKDSSEYEKAGGKRKSERKKRKPPKPGPSKPR